MEFPFYVSVRFRRKLAPPGPGGWIFYPSTCFLLLGTLPASSQGGRSTWQSYHLIKNRPFLDMWNTEYLIYAWAQS